MRPQPLEHNMTLLFQFFQKFGLVKAPEVEDETFNLRLQRSGLQESRRAKRGTVFIRTLV